LAWTHKARYARAEQFQRLVCAAGFEHFLPATNPISAAVFVEVHAVAVILTSHFPALD
jgi:hypothetical protein